MANLNILVKYDSLILVTIMEYIVTKTVDRQASLF